MNRQQDALLRLGQRLMAVRRQKDLSLTQLSALTGLNSRDIAAIEAGDTDPTITTLIRLCLGLGISPDLLLTGFPPKA